MWHLKKIFMAGLLVVGSCGLGHTSCAWAHPFHTTTAEMEYNSETGRFEVALKVLASDLEEVLTRQAVREFKVASRLDRSQAAQPPGGWQRVTLDGTPEVERLIIAYLEAHFFLTSHNQDSAHNDSDGTNGAKKLRGEGADTQPKRNGASVHQPSSAERRSSVHWVGIELDKSWAWLYFELKPPQVDKLSLGNDVFVELNAQQINTCALRARGAKYSLRTDARQPRVVLPPQARS